MALYEYACESCGHRFEIIQKMSDPPLEKCPKCGGPVRKLQSAPAFHLKGTGWYVTDYAKKDSSSATKSSDESKESKESKDTKETKDLKDSKDTNESKTSEKTEKSTESPKSTTSESTPSTTPKT